MRKFIFRKFSTKRGKYEIFDLEKKANHRLLSVTREDSDYYDYLRKEIAERIVDRLDDISRQFPRALDLGCHKGQICNQINSRLAPPNSDMNASDKLAGIGGIEEIVECDIFQSPIYQNLQNSEDSIQREFHVLDLSNPSQATSTDPPNFLPFAKGSFDLVLSSMFLHWVNDVPTLIQNIRSLLKPDGAFIAAFIGGSSLKELKHCYYLAELDRTGGASMHTSPFLLPSDFAGLLQDTGFSLPTIDSDIITVTYPNALTLMEHLSRMGEGLASLPPLGTGTGRGRERGLGGRDALLAMAAIYQELYGMEDGSVPATFQIIYAIGWSPHPSQQKACKRGSATASFKDLNNKK